MKILEDPKFKKENGYLYLYDTGRAVWNIVGYYQLDDSWEALCLCDPVQAVWVPIPTRYLGDSYRPDGL